MKLLIAPKHFQQMLDHVSKDTSMEACGLLGGVDSRVDQVVPITNVAASPVRFRMDPEEQVQAMFGFEDTGLELIAIYHSHPSGPSGPSQIDLDEAAYPEAVQLIWFMDEGEWICQAYRYEDDKVREVTLSEK